MLFFFRSPTYVNIPINCHLYQDLRKISLKPSLLRSLRSYAFGTLGERGSLFRDLCVSPITLTNFSLFPIISKLDHVLWCYFF
ncbi:MAG: hypothetical protein ACKO9U_21545, partial [Dolichospermum sp.]